MTTSKLTADSLREQAHGRWLEIFSYLCPGMFEDAIANIGNHVTCPFHGGEEDFRFIKRKTNKGGNTAQTGVAMCTCGFYVDGFAVLQRALGTPFYDTLKLVDNYLNGSIQRTSVPKPAPVIRPELDEQETARLAAENLQKMRNLWNHAKPFTLRETPYYLARGLSMDYLSGLCDLRMRDSLGYFRQEKGEVVKLGTFPAILALMRAPDGAPIAIHRTWLSADRKSKAPVPKAKKLTPPVQDILGSAIRLFSAEGEETLGLTEGIETALAARELTFRGYFEGLGAMPVWACYSEANLRRFQIPEKFLKTLKRIVVFADNDASGTGMKAALAFQERMAQEHPEIQVVIEMPKTVGDDFVDVLVKLKAH